MYNIIFAGTPAFADVSLNALLAAGHQIIAVYTQPDKPAGRGQKLVPSAVKQTALAHGIPIMQPKTLRDPAAQAELAALNADLMIVAAYGLILPQAVLDTPRLGCINIHGSLLPRWRGAAPIQRAILAGDDTTGITIMQMEAGLDTGPMLYTLACPITQQDTGSSLHDKMAQLGAEALLKTLVNLPHYLTQAEKQNDSLACYADKIQKSEAQINWQQSADIIARKIRAFNAWPVAYCMVQEQTLRIWQAEVVNQEINKYQPGQIIAANKQGIDVATGCGILRLLSLQLPNQKTLSTTEILNGRAHLFIPGTFLI